jgi:NitT/TauT family transport system substrate-binding protein
MGSEPDLQDVPAMLAFEDLAERGINVETTAYNQTDIQLQALVSGEIDIAAGSLAALLTANDAGGDFVAFAEQSGNDWQLMSKASIATPEDLDGARVAYHSEVAFDRAMLQMVADNAGVTPNWVLMPGSEVRAAALLDGQIDATAASAQDAILIADEGGADFHTLVPFKDELPNLMTAVLFGSREYVEGNEALLREVMTAVLARYAEIKTDGGATVKAEAARFLPGVDQALIDKAVDAYIDLDYWMADGGMSQERAEFSAEFYTDANDLSAQPAVDTFYTEALVP